MINDKVFNVLGINKSLQGVKYPNAFNTLSKTLNSKVNNICVEVRIQ